MSILETLKEQNVDTEQALERFVGNEELYIRMLKKLPDETAKKKVVECIRSGDLKLAEENAHALKGTTGNLSITPLYEAYSEIVELLRKGDSQGALKKAEEILPYQEEIISVIEKG